MALKLMSTIVDNALENEGVTRCYLVHRIGKVDVGKASILIACSSSHRSQAHKTVMNILNDVKSKVPIWKRPCTSLNVQLGNWSDRSEAFWLSEPFDKPNV